MSEEYKLPLDIQIEIMKRIPVKSLMKFISVSKQWKSIIRSSRFITDYSASHIQSHLFFVFYLFNNCVDIYNDANDDISFLQPLTHNMSAEHPDLEFYQLIGHSQGLLGFLSYNKITSKDVIVIYNPSIRESVVIPFLEQWCYPTNYVFTVCDATGPIILKTTSYIVRSLWRVEIYKLSMGVWRTLSNAPRRQSLQLAMSVSTNRFIHWIAYDRTPEGVKLNNLILSFDISNEEFTKICLPPCLAQHTCLRTLHLSKLRESLVVLQTSVDTKETHVWMMEDGVQNSFRKLYTVKPPDTKICPKVLGFRKKGQPIVYFESYSDRKVLLFYESDLVRFDQSEISGYACPSTAGSYMETLLLLDH